MVMAQLRWSKTCFCGCVSFPLFLILCHWGKPLGLYDLWCFLSNEIKQVFKVLGRVSHVAKMYRRSVRKERNGSKEEMNRKTDEQGRIGDEHGRTGGGRGGTGRNREESSGIGRNREEGEERRRQGRQGRTRKKKEGNWRKRKARKDKERHGRTRKDKEGQGRTRKDKEGQGKSSSHYIPISNLEVLDHVQTLPGPCPIPAMFRLCWDSLLSARFLLPCACFLLHPSSSAVIFQSHHIPIVGPLGVSSNVIRDGFKNFRFDLTKPGCDVFWIFFSNVPNLVIKHELSMLVSFQQKEYSKPPIFWTTLEVWNIHFFMAPVVTYAVRDQRTNDDPTTWTTTHWGGSGRSFPCTGSRRFGWSRHQNEGL